MPQLFGGTGAAAIGDGYKSDPWTMGYLPSFRAEGAIYGRSIAKLPSPKVGVLYEELRVRQGHDDGLKTGPRREGVVDRLGAGVRADRHVDRLADVDAARVGRERAGAEHDAAVRDPRLRRRAQARLAPADLHQLGLDLAERDGHRRGCKRRRDSANGSLSIAFVKDPTDKVWAKDPVVKLYKQILAKYAPGAKPDDVYNFYGMGVAYTMVDALKHAGKNPTRASLLAAAHAPRTRSTRSCVRASRSRPSPTDYYPISKAQLVRYDRVHWVAAGPRRARLVTDSGVWRSERSTSTPRFTDYAQAR